MRDYGFSSYPSMVLIKNGEIVYSHSGKMTESQLSAQIDKYL
jgi:thioredoxin-like negative regulator of GroEL